MSACSLIQWALTRSAVTMARPSTISTEQIIRAAREVFLEKGIRATTAEVARRAGVAEGSIFNRFKTKEELFAAAMELTHGDAGWVKLLHERVECEDVAATMIQVGARVLSFFRGVLPLMMMSWSNACDIPDLLKQPNPPPLRALKGVASFFEEQMRRGRIRRQDPEILARCFIGSLQNYVFFELLLRAHDEVPLAEEAFLRGLVDLMWHGMSPGRSTDGETSDASRDLQQPPRGRALAKTRAKKAGGSKRGAPRSRGRGS